MPGFDELEYTRDREVKALVDIQDHASDGSALEGCTCLQGKHFFKLESNSEEGITIANREAEKKFYEQMAPFARAARKAIIDQTWKFPNVADIQEEQKHETVPGNPRTRAFLPHGLTECEASHKDVRHRLSRCIEEAELKCCGKHTRDYSKCQCNPIAVCRASVSCP